MKRLVLALPLLVLLPSVAAAGPWTPAPGHGYVKVWMKWLYGFGYHPNDGGGTIDYARYNEVFFATYGEYGMADGLAVFWHTDLVRVFTLDDPLSGDRRVHTAPGDPLVGLRWRFLHLDRFVMSIEGGVRAPLADDVPKQDVFTRDAPYRRIGTLRVGAGVWNVDGRLSAGYGFDRVYLAGSVGYQWRGDGFRDRITWSAEIGGSFTDRWSGRARASGTHSLALEGDDAPLAQTPSGIGNGVSWAGIALELDYRLGQQWFVGLTLEGGLGDLRSQTGGPVTSLWVATQF